MKDGIDTIGDTTRAALSQPADTLGDKTRVELSKMAVTLQEIQPG